MIRANPHLSVGASYGRGELPSDRPARTPNNFSALLRRRWRFLAVAAAISFAAATAAAYAFARTEWTFMGTLAFSRNQIGSPYYIAPDIRTHLAHFKSRELLSSVRDEFRLGIPVWSLSNLVDAQVPSGSDSIDVTFKWEDGPQAQAMLDRMLEIFVERVEVQRRQSVERFVRDFSKSLEQSKLRVVEGKSALNGFNARHQVVDVEMDLSHMKDELRSLETALENAKVRRRNNEAQLARLHAIMSEAEESGDTASFDKGPNDGKGGGVKTAGAEQPATPSELNQPSDAAKAADPKSTAKASDDGGDRAKSAPRPLATADLQRRALLRERILDERQKILDETELTLKRKEYERAKSLHEKKFVSDAEFARIEAELQALVARRSTAMRSLEDQLRKIESRIPSALNASGETNLTFDRLAETLTTLELEAIATAGEVAHLESYVAGKRQELERLLALRPQARALADDLDAAVRERQRQESLLATFEQMLSSEAHEFVISQPAEPTLEPLRSNRMKLFGATFLLCCVGLTLPVVVYDLRMRGQCAAERMARRMGLPFLSRFVGRSADRAFDARIDVRTQDDATRLLALRVQQAIDKSGFVAMFTSLSAEPSPAPLFARLGQCLAERGERVLLIDLRDASADTRGFADLRVIGEPRTEGETAGASASQTVSGAGVRDYLIDASYSFEQVTLPSALPGVDCILAGRAALPRESFASRRMSEFVDTARARYSVILVAGPTLNRSVDLEMLAARVDGIILECIGRRIDPMAELAVGDLIELAAPILGVVG